MHVLNIFRKTLPTIEYRYFSVTDEMANYIMDCLKGIYTPHEGAFVAMESIHEYLKPKIKSQPEQVPPTASLIKKMMAKTFPTSLCVSTEDSLSKEQYPLSIPT